MTRLRLTAALIAAFILSACANPPQPPTKDAAEKAMKSIFPSAKVISVSATPINGLYEVSLDNGGQKGIVYLDPTAAHLVAGPMLDIAQKKDLTRERLRSMYKVDFSSIPLTDAIKVGPDSAKVRMVVFTDPDCPFCRKYHPELVKLTAISNDVQVLIKVTPNPQTHPDAVAKSRTILCAKDNSAARKLLEDAFSGKKLAAPACEAKEVEANVEMFHKLGFSGWPATIMDDGSRAEGYVAAEDLAKYVATRMAENTPAAK